MTRERTEKIPTGIRPKLLRLICAAKRNIAHTLYNSYQTDPKIAVASTMRHPGHRTFVIALGLVVLPAVRRAVAGTTIALDNEGIAVDDLYRCSLAKKGDT